MIASIGRMVRELQEKEISQIIYKGLLPPEKICLGDNYYNYLLKLAKKEGKKVSDYTKYL